MFSVLLKVPYVQYTTYLLCTVYHIPAMYSIPPTCYVQYATYLLCAVFINYLLCAVCHLPAMCSIYQLPAMCSIPPTCYVKYTTYLPCTLHQCACTFASGYTPLCICVSLMYTRLWFSINGITCSPVSCCDVWT